MYVFLFLLFVSVVLCFVAFLIISCCVLPRLSLLRRFSCLPLLRPVYRFEIAYGQYGHAVLWTVLTS